MQVCACQLSLQSITLLLAPSPLFLLLLLLSLLLLLLVAVVAVAADDHIAATSAALVAAVAAAAATAFAAAITAVVWCCCCLELLLLLLLLLLLVVVIGVAVAVDVAVKDPSGCHIAVAVDVQICKTRQLNSKAKSTKMDELVNLGHQGIAVVSGRRGKEVWRFQRQQGCMDPKQSEVCLREDRRTYESRRQRQCGAFRRSPQSEVKVCTGVLQVRV